MTFALPGIEGSYAVDAATPDPLIHQEVIEVLYHTLWETVHVFFEHRELGHEVGESGFLYPFLGTEKQRTSDLVAEVASSIMMKVHDDAKQMCIRDSRRADHGLRGLSLCAFRGLAEEVFNGFESNLKGPSKSWGMRVTCWTPEPASSRYKPLPRAWRA